MAETTFTFRVEDSLKTAFAKAAKAQDRTGAQLLRDFMRQIVHQQAEIASHADWFRSQVEQGLREADNPFDPRMTHDETMRAMRERIDVAAGRRANERAD